MTAKISVENPSSALEWKVIQDDIVYTLRVERCEMLQLGLFNWAGTITDSSGRETFSTAFQGNASTGYYFGDTVIDILSSGVDLSAPYELAYTIGGEVLGDPVEAPKRPPLSTN